MEEIAQRIRRLACNLCPGKPLGKKRVLQAVFLHLQQLGIIQVQVNAVSLDSTCIYEGDETRTLALALGYMPVVPPKKNRKNPWNYDEQLYKQRNQVERLFRRIKRFRRVFTRYDKLDVVFLSFVYFALIIDTLM